jgi:hypothetical protein
MPCNCATCDENVGGALRAATGHLIQRDLRSPLGTATPTFWSQFQESFSCRLERRHVR